MRNYIILIGLLVTLYAKAQVEPFVDYDWTIEKIETFDGTTILADASSSGFYDQLLIDYSDFFGKYVFEFSACLGEYSFDDPNQEFKHSFGCAISPNQTIIAEHFTSVFILEEGGETVTEEGTVYGPFSYDFSYTEDLVYLHITNLAGSVATFYATFLSQDEFINESITIYPNPAINILKIKSPGVIIDNIKIYDLRGRLVEKYDGVKNQMDVSHLQQGVFIIEIETARGILRRKLIKK